MSSRIAKYFPVPCNLGCPMYVRLLGWCVVEKLWKTGQFIMRKGERCFKPEERGPLYGENEISHWVDLPPSP